MANRHAKKIAEVEGPEVQLYVQTNSPADPAPYEMLKMFYRGAYDNTIGLMQAKDEETGELVYLIVGLRHDEESGNVGAIPIAKVFSYAEEAGKYLAPDGKGGYSRDSV